MKNLSKLKKGDTFKIDSNKVNLFSGKTIYISKVIAEVKNNIIYTEDNIKYSQSTGNIIK
jgi:hypothetical protein